MIIPNGYISFRLSGATGLDDNGYPTLSPDAWGNMIECQYLPSVNLRARGNNEAYTAHSYTVYVEQMTVPSEIVKLYDMNECEIMTKSFYNFQISDHLFNQGSLFTSCF